MNILFATWHLGGKNPRENRGIVVNQYQPEQAGLSKVQQSVFCSASSLVQKEFPSNSIMGIWVVATQTFFIFIPNPGEMIQFDEHIFQLG